jgi:Ala-tRNA(Pro) deacylase
MAIAHTVQNFMVRHDVDYDLMQHPPTACSHETAKAARIPEDHLAKAVILRDSMGYSMVVVPANDWVELDQLRREYNRDFHLATEGEVARLFQDCSTGAVPPIGPAYGMETFLDESLDHLGSVYFEAGDHQELVHTLGEDFQELMHNAKRGHYIH